MEIRTTARRVKLTPSVQKHLEQRLDKLRRYVQELDHADVKLTSEKHRFKAEILIHVRHRDRVAQEEASDLMAAIDGAANRLERQLRRLKERGVKASSRPRSNGTTPRSAARAALEAVAAEPEGAAPAPDQSREGSAEASPGRRPEIVRRRLGGDKPMSVDEASDHLMESGLEFLVFLDSRSECPCVLYRRRDGRLGLIEARR